MRLTYVLSLVAFWVCGALTAGEPPRIAFITGEYEYASRTTLPAFANDLESKFQVETFLLARPEDAKKQTIPGLDRLAGADLVVLYVRRMTLPESELSHVRNYLKSGKPLIGLRTASHAFENWKEFDHEVLGGNYQNHHGNKLKTTVTPVPAVRENPILRGFQSFVSDGSLYRNTPLSPGAMPLLMGKVDGHPPEPVAWTHQANGNRVFYTSLGHPNDFAEEQFRGLLVNAIEWALEKPLEKRESE